MKYVLLAFAFVAAVVALAEDGGAPRCGVRCFSGTVTWDDGAPPVHYAFSVLPCEPTVVVSARVGGEDVAASARFVCAEHEDSERVLFTLFTSAVTLEWEYEAPNRERCVALLAEIDTLPVRLTATHHRVGVHRAEHAASLDDVEVLCDAEGAGAAGANGVSPSGGGSGGGATSIDGPCYDTGVVLAAGRAGVKSPCGVAGATAPCALRVLFSTAPENPTVDVLVGADGVSLRLYRPAAVAGPAEVACDARSGEITVSTAGVRVEFDAPTDHSATCEAMLAYPTRLATGRLRAVLVRLGGDDETWVFTRRDTDSEVPTFASAATECAVMREQLAGKQPTAGDVDDLNNTVHTADAAPTLAHALVPLVTCSSRFNHGATCCTVFGYRNPNADSVVLAAGATHNYLVPSPEVLSQPSSFSANTTVAEAFSVMWACPEYKRHTLRWILKTPALHADAWQRWADASRDRDDCTTEQQSEWCSL
jgi:hypothetical protein